MSTSSGPPPSSYSYVGGSSPTMSNKPTASSSSSLKASKRHSMPPISSASGPRPLHLIDLAGSITTSSPTSALSPTRPSMSSSPLHVPSPSLPTSISSPHSQLPTPRSAKRQSAISYFSPDHVSIREKELLVKRSSSPATSTFERSVSAGDVTGALHSATNRANAAGTKSGVLEDHKERPLTTAEKHAELLHFIAQKEAKCLELRSQLAMHEEELLQLKRKWERIINRGLERENSTSLSSPAYPTNPKDIPAALMSLTTNPTLTLDGIREGVQGMSRLLAAGLSMSNESPRPPKLGVPSSSRNSQSSSPIPPSPLSITTTIPSGRLSARHAPRESDSSNATWTTRSSSVDLNRLSQCSSATSLEDDDDAAAKRAQSGTVTVNHSKNGSMHSSPQELLLMDTGATPTMSPNPKFLEQKARRRKRQEEKKEEEATLAAEERRKAAENVDEWGTWGEPADKKDRGEDKEGQRHDRVSATTTSMQHSGTFWLMDPPPKPIEKKSQEGKDRRGAVQSSWMGSMGKKLGGELSSTQKRASLILSDMSQSFLSTLSSPPTDTPSTMSLTASSTVSSISTSPSSPLPSVSDPTFGLVSPVPSSKPNKRHSLAVSAPLSRSTSLSRNSSANRANGNATKSLLDDDDGFGPMVSSGSVMQPDNVKKPAKAAAVNEVQDDEDEWNW